MTMLNLFKNPYRSWFLLKEKDIYLGSFYIQKDNSIGINSITYEEEKVLWCLEFIKNFQPLAPIKSFNTTFFLQTFLSKNNEMISLLKEGWQPIQLSFKV